MNKAACSELISIEVMGIFISPGHDFKGRHGKERITNEVVSKEEARCLAGKGIEGDRYCDCRENFKGQITFFEWEVLERLRSSFRNSAIPPSAPRRNVILKGIDLNTLIGRRFQIQGAIFEGSEHCAPCYWMDVAILPGAEKALKNKGGLRARILQTGHLRLGKTELGVCRT